MDESRTHRHELGLPRVHSTWHRLSAAAAAVVTVGALAAGLQASVGASGHAAPAAAGTARLTPGKVVAPPPATSPPVSASALKRYRWTSLPPAPIPVRTGSAATWTGSLLFVWGGSIGNDARSDGALYNPSARHWTKLPKAPLSASAQPQAVTVGQSVIVWTGSEGARFDLRTRRWSTLPALAKHSSVSSTGETAQLAAAAGRAVLVRAIRDRPLTLDADVFDPRRDRWTSDRQIVLPSGQQLSEIDALAGASQVAVWPAWYHETQTRTKTGLTVGIHGGIDSYSVDARTGTWHTLTVQPDSAHSADGVLWAGRRVMFPELFVNCGPCSQPFPAGLKPRLVDPATGRSTTLPDDPLGPVGTDLFWTGGALLSYDSSGQSGSIGPGALALWNPSTNRWQRLASARVPSSANQGVRFWTRRSLLVWGIGSAKGVAAGTGGLQFAAG